MLEIISILLSVITIALTIYELFFKNSSNAANQCIQKNLILQINPMYSIDVNYHPIDNSNNIDIDNALWKSKRMTQFVIVLLYISLATNFLNYIKLNKIESLTGLTAMVYLPLKNTMLQLSIILIIICMIFMVRAWDKQQTLFSNFLNMKYFTFKIVSDILSVIAFCFVNYSFLEKVNANIQNTLISFNLISWILLFTFQIMWIQFTVSKINNTIPATNSYEVKERQILSFVPVYICSILVLVLIIYTKFFLN